MHSVEDEAMQITITKRPRGQGHRRVSPFVPLLGGGASMIDAETYQVDASSTLAKRAP